jgi:hypothetical protein
MRPSLENKSERTRGVAQVIELLLSKCKAQTSISSTRKEKKMNYVVVWEDLGTGVDRTGLKYWSCL